MFHVYSFIDTPRLRYVLDWVLVERWNCSYELIIPNQEAALVPGITYGFDHPGCITIPQEGLLENGIRDASLLQTDCWAPENQELNFDIFSAVFFLLSRMEEWGSEANDHHGRYSHTESLLHKKGWLQLPIVDIWLEKLRHLLNAHFGMDIPAPVFHFLPTYDIDIAWSYRHKGWKRSIGGSFRDLLRCRIGDRLKVLSGSEKDPYDAFDSMQLLHKEAAVKPLHFILAALQDSPFDKNISPKHPAMRDLIRRLQQESVCYLHPSYFSQTIPGRFEAEKQVLKEITGTGISQSRQHYIRYNLPETPRFLLAQGIRDDYSMGYATTTGFRAGTSHSFLWYDLEKESVPGLRLHPFCFMDSTAHYDLGLSVENAFSRLRQIRDIVEKTGGMLITVFHNFSLGTDKEWAGWFEAYAAFVKETAASRPKING